MSAPPPKTTSEESLVSRLRDVRVGLREDLEVTRHLFRGRVSYVVRDPLTFETQRFDRADYQVLTRITPSRSLGEIFARMVSDGLSEPDDEESFYRFIMSLHRLGFLRLPISDDRLLYRRYQARERAQRRAKIRGFLFLRIPVFNPDAFLHRTLHLVQPLFSRIIFAFWLMLIVAAGYVVWHRWHELVEPIHGLLAARNLPLIWLTLIGLKVFHEFGHAYTCKHFGGSVPEMGVFLVLFTPCAYMDASAAWGFTRKSQRIMVSLAGMYVESIIAAVAVFVWALTEDSLLRSVAYNVIFLAGIVTVMFNINPLMRYDGYYVVSDWLEIPNLRQRATQYVIGLMKRLFLGIDPKLRASGRRTKALLTAFGLAAITYRATLLLAISALLITRFKMIGIVFSTIYLGGAILRLALRLTTYLWYAEETRGRRARGVVLGMLVLVVLPMTAAFIPVPSYVHAAAVIGAEQETVVRVKTPGFVQSIHVKPNQYIETGTEIVQLSNDVTTGAVIDARARLMLSTIRANKLRTINPLQAEQQQAVTELSERNLEQAIRNRDDLDVKAGIHGRVATCIDSSEAGSYLAEGAPVATVIAGRRQAHALLTADQVARLALKVGDLVELRIADDPSRVRWGRLVRTAPGGSKYIKYPSLTHVGGGGIAVNPATGEASQPYFELSIDLSENEDNAPPYGTTGSARLRAGARPIVATLAHRIARFWNRLIER